MSSGTKILLAVVTLFVGTLVIYYGFVMPSGEEPPPPEEEAAAERTPERPADAHAEARPGPAAEPLADAAGDGVAPAPGPRRSPAQSSGAGATGRAAASAERERSAAPDDVLAGAGPAAARTGAPAGRAGDPLPVLPTATPRAAPPTAPAAAPPAAAAPAARDLDRPATRAPAPGPEARASRAPHRPRVPATAPRYTPYTVKEGDTMTSIAERWFGDHRKWDLIAKANLVDPNRLRIGQVLRLPPKEAERAAVEGRADAERMHTVGPGDTLSAIAVAHYGDIAMWERIYRANRRVIGPNPDDLAVGMELTIPALNERTSSAATGR